jgi:NAD(P)-dependent dehydrogenase (short-subunit alcohol dehydrogenase family)
VIRTDMTAPVAARYAQRIAEGLSPIRRWGEAEDVAKAVAALLTGAIPFSTGDAFHVDGGLHLHRL